MNIPCWIMATIAGVWQNRAENPLTTDVLNMAASQPLVFDAELDTVRERLGSVKGVNYDTAMWGSAINTRQRDH
ncbi:autotransporter outer membrane beta-barrel domain-containing protein [Shigella flexneri]